MQLHLSRTSFGHILVGKYPQPQRMARDFVHTSCPMNRCGKSGESIKLFPVRIFHPHEHPYRFKNIREMHDNCKHKRKLLYEQVTKTYNVSQSLGVLFT